MRKVFLKGHTSILGEDGNRTGVNYNYWLFGLIYVRWFCKMLKTKVVKDKETTLQMQWYAKLDIRQKS